jgi:hypothetical protein
MIPLASPNRPAGSGLPDSPNAMDAVPKAAADAAMSFLVSMAVDGILEGVADSSVIRNPSVHLRFLCLGPCALRHAAIAVMMAMAYATIAMMIFFFLLMLRFYDVADCLGAIMNARAVEKGKGTVLHPHRTQNERHPAFQETRAGAGGP